MQDKISLLAFVRESCRIINGALRYKPEGCRFDSQ